MAHSIRAFSNPNYDYFKLTKPFGMLKKGTIFYHDPNDDVYGSTSQGCLKNCWSPDGNCLNGLCGGTVILHYDFVKTDWFVKVERKATELMETLDKGHYRLQVNDDGSWDIHKYGTGA